MALLVPLMKINVWNSATSQCESNLYIWNGIQFENVVVSTKIWVPSSKFTIILWHGNVYKVTYIPKVNECWMWTQWFMIYLLWILHQLYHLENSVKMRNIFLPWQKFSDIAFIYVVSRACKTHLNSTILYMAIKWAQKIKKI